MAQRGRLMVLNTDLGSGLEPIMTGRSIDFNINGETVDVTTQSQLGWRELLADAGVRSVSMSVEGVYKDEAISKAFTQRANNQAVDEYVLELESGESWTGRFQAVSLSISGTYNGEVAYTLTLESDGTVVYDDGSEYELIAAQDETDFTGLAGNGSFVGGTGYDAADVITLSNGTTVTVDAVGVAGTVTEFSITTVAGLAVQSATLTQASVAPAGGTGFTLTPGANNIALV